MAITRNARPWTLLLILPALAAGPASADPPVPPQALYVDDDNCPGPGTGAPDDPYCRITDAVAAAEWGFVILVGPGFYPERVVIDKPLQLRGAQQGVAGARRTGPESIVEHACEPFRVAASQVTIEGFTIQGATAGPGCSGAGITVSPGQSSMGFRANIIQGNTLGMRVATSPLGILYIDLSLFRANGNPGTASGTAILSDEGLSGAYIDDNVSEGGAFVFQRTVDATITGNVISGTPGDAIRLGGGDDGFTITCNSLSGAGGRGLYVADGIGGAPNGHVVARFNNIQGNALAGIEVAPGAHAGAIVGERNWWGHITGPSGTGKGKGDKVLGNVVYKPFQTAPLGPVCPFDVQLDVIPFDAADRIDTRSKKQVGIAVLADTTFDPLRQIVVSSADVRGARAKGKKTQDVNLDGLKDLVLMFVPAEMRKPTPSECGNPYAILSLTAATASGTPVSGHGHVDWVGADCP